MAFQDVSQRASGEAIKLTGLKVGQTITGFVVNFVPSLQNPENMNILMQDEDGGATRYVYTAGNMKYLIGDGKIKKGLLTKIERLADKDVKGKKSSQFRVLQDPERTIEVSATTATAAPASEDSDESFNAIESSSATKTEATKAAVERSIKNQAAKLSASMGKRN